MFYNPKMVKKWCEANKGEMDLYGNLTKEALVGIAKTIEKQNHSGGGISVIRRCLLLMLIDSRKTLRKIGFKRKLITFADIEKKEMKK